MGGWYRWAVSSLTALLLAALLCLSGVLVSVGVTRWDYSGHVKRMVREVKTRNSELIALVGNRRTYQVANLYLTAVADATVRFEFFPGNDVAHFLSVLRSLPSGVQVTEFAFVGRALQIHCSGETEEELQQFAENIRARGAYADVSCITWVEGGGLARGNIACYSALAPQEDVLALFSPQA